MLRKAVALLIFICLALSTAFSGSAELAYRFADAEEAGALILSHRAFFERLTQNDLDFRMQKKGATLQELEAFTARQTLDFTEADKAAIDEAMRRVDAICRERGYALPPVDGITFAKTTMKEECGASAYTHGTLICFGPNAMRYAASKEPGRVRTFRELLAHEIFHCLTRTHPDFRADMLGILGFTVADSEYDFAPAIRDAIISNPDVERHDAFAAFSIGGRMRDCVVVLTYGKPFARSGDSFFDDRVIGLVPVDDLGTLYTSDDAANFRDVFGRNTDYVIDPEETMAENFALAIMRGVEGVHYSDPGIIEAIDARLKSGTCR